MIDRVARRVTEPHTLAAIDDQAVQAHRPDRPKQFKVWLLRLVVRLEPLAFEERHRRALAERRVTVVQGVDGIGYVTGEVSAADAAAIDGVLAATARSLGAEDPRTEQQRRSDLFADLLLGRLAFDRPDDENDDELADESDWLEVENIDPETGELLGTQLQRIDGNGELVGEPVDAATRMLPGGTPMLVRRPEDNGSESSCHSPACSAPPTHRPSWLIGLGSYLQRCSGNKSPKPSIRIAATRCCSLGCSPTMAVGCSTQPNSAATPRPGSPKRSGSAPAPVDSQPAPCPPTAATLIIMSRFRGARPPDRTSTRSADGITGAKRSLGMPPSETRTASTGPYRRRTLPMRRPTTTSRTRVLPLTT